MPHSIADLARRLEQLEAENRALAADNRALAARVGELEGSAPSTASSDGSPDRPGARTMSGGTVSRRGLLRQFGTAAAAAGGLVAGASVINPQPAAALSGNLQFGTTNDAGTDDTQLTSTTSSTTFAAYNGAADGTAALLGEIDHAECPGFGVWGQTVGTGAAVRAEVPDAGSNATSMHAVNYGLGTAVVASCEEALNGSPAVVANQIGNGAGVQISTSHGHCIDGWSEGQGHGAYLNTTGSGTGVVVAQDGSGRGLLVTMSDVTSSSSAAKLTHAGLGKGVEVALTKSSNGSNAVHATTAGGGNALYGATSGAGRAMYAYVTSAANTLPAALAQTKGSGPGVEGISTSGVGGRFTGKTAQVRLVASGSSSHPSSGTKGDLFVDSSGRLWFCKGGTTWKQLA